MEARNRRGKAFLGSGCKASSAFNAGISQGGSWSNTGFRSFCCNSHWSWCGLYDHRRDGSSPSQGHQSLREHDDEVREKRSGDVDVDVDVDVESESEMKTNDAVCSECTRRAFEKKC